MGFAAARDALFAGAVVNPSEGRPATHVAERGSGAPEDVDLATARRQRMRALVDAIEAGAFGDITGVLHIGIGGSVLGPAFLVDALGRRSATLTVRFLSNIDGGLRRCGEAARSGHYPRHGRFEDLHDARNADESRSCSRLAP
jgi:glucose-6-phosphate isomerase